MRIVTRLIAGASAAVLLAACAGLQPSTPEEAVAKRAQARYDALIARDFKAVYAFFTPAYRQRTSYEDWIRARPPRATFRSARVLGVRCETADACEANVQNSYDSPRGVRGAPKGEIDRVTTERWIRVDGRWWLFQAR